ncbi:MULTISPECIES: DNA-directed RNA polymerase subunit omega [Staphylococcaceae]|uniref:DNA-directed RNA polymerase subunit omega n=2 Tax=Staphylococcaceae TaxID=90964 RepID=A0A1W7AC44_9STAP|nr:MULTISPECIES: DNA-directed RNA polymerase subunit omega [Macrococcus]ARQ06670.1 DNA-directed RNA polymerase subunit omega [Macrococcus canis]MEE1108366.1 DNA-directed RNA polymerase subunit omega [Macrococcus canis]TDM17960.1 DNA-directed RNA polymerase subunit omega [Macrococcus canis]TDM24481.1 DNA-directed RNA polymerase subunit omega [Macrococcus canis]TDM32570.1 DNA-directed RNA polymerase subunit omega [Macrococcus canis]
MLYPPLDKLKEKVNSKYLIVTLAAKRAREMQDHPDVKLIEKYNSYKPVGQSLEEIAAGKIHITNEHPVE